ncbi:fimbria/pilus outer membrane usher protein [Burkholderia pseudomultivorans]|uniref:fimbria/pilus outer membrane usher protein n=1 Tax=Burkholderia pseudomultivorans TaxID=1207504 RepID=UPI0009BEB008|nr:fimbria/pilus outer membrane usher protein [Burkholderia pseudomultivorans]
MWYKALNSRISLAAPFSRTPFVAAIALFTAGSIAPLAASADSDRAVFNNEFLRFGGGPQQVDLSAFAFGNRVLPGRYQVTVVVNGENFDKEDIEMVAAGDDVDATPCVTRDRLSKWNINTAAFASISQAAQDACIDIAAAIPQASAQFNVATQTLEISVPQAAMLRRARGTVPIDQLENGTTAFMLNYQLNGSHDYLNQQSSLYANINAGLNIGPWRFRSLSTFNHDQRGSKFQSQTMYAERALLGINSRLTIGDAYTTGIGDDSFGLRGIQLQTDETMRPDSMRGYAPIVRGIARTSAEVTIRQNGYVINKVFVPPGPFVIDDLYATPGAGDLEVTIVEADGATTRYTQPYAALPTLVRGGLLNYSVATGLYRDAIAGNGPYVGQGMLAYGLTSDVTVYGSAVLSGIYGAISAGVGLNLKDFGALAIDVTRTQLYSSNVPRVSGSAFRLTYAKALPGYGTSFRMVSTRYMTDGYRSLAQAVNEDRGNWQNESNLRTQLSATIAQQLGTYGSLYATATRQGYRNRGADTLLQLGYTTSIRKATVSLNYNEISNSQSPGKERQALLNVSIPLGRSSSSASYQLRTDGNGDVNQQASIFGSLLANNNLSYTAQLAKSTNGTQNAYASLYYQGSKGNIGFNHNEGTGSRVSQVSYGGGLIVDSHGPLLSQPLGETIGIIEVPDAAGVTIDGYPGVTTDSHGRAVVPSLIPYRKNRISVDATQTTKDNVDLVESAVTVAPTRGAVTYSTLRADVGMRTFARLHLPNGDDVPFGAVIKDEAKDEKGSVGPMGRVFLSGLKGDSIKYTATWGASAEKHCSFTIDSTHLQEKSDEHMVDVECTNGSL